MDDIANAVAIIRWFLVPGLVATKIVEMVWHARPKPLSDSLYEVLGYGAMSFAVVSIVFPAIEKVHINVTEGWGYFLVSVIVPILLSLAISLIAGKRMGSPWGSAWAYAFRNRKAGLVIVHLKNGRPIAGKLGRRSCAGDGYEDKGLYLEQVWELDETGAFERQTGASVLIDASEAIAIEFME